MSRKTDSKLLKWVVEQRDRVCMWGLFGEEPSPCRFGMDPHHIIKRSAGGKDVTDNIITLCRKHHDEAEGNLISAEQLRSVLSFVYGYEYGDKDE